MSGTDGMDRSRDRERDRRQGGDQDWGQGWGNAWNQGATPAGPAAGQGNAPDPNQSVSQSQDPSQWQGQPQSCTQDAYGRANLDTESPRDGMVSNRSDPREVPVVPGRFLRNQPPEQPPVPRWPAPSPVAPAGETPTRSIPVLSRPGSAPGANPSADSSPTGVNATPAMRRGGVERARGTPVGGIGNGTSEGSAIPAWPGQPQSVPLRGAYVVEETQELVLPAGSQGAGGAMGAMGSAGEASGPRPSVLNAASAAAAAYRQQGDTDETGGMRNQMTGANQAGGSYRGGPHQTGEQQAVAQQQRPMHAAVPHAGPSHVGWHAAEDWGTVTITMSANHAAGFSYLFGWLSGIFFFFGERENRYVRFHAMQSILLTVPFTVLAIGLYVLVNVVLAKQLDLVAVYLWLTLAVLLFLAMIGVWLWTLAAAWSGHWLRLPIIGYWADYFSAPPQDPYAQAGA